MGRYKSSLRLSIVNVILDCGSEEEMLHGRTLVNRTNQERNVLDEDE